MTHDELVDRAAIWLRTKQKCQVVFAEMVTYARANPDAIGWSSGRSHLIEVKVSRSDFKRDPHKVHHRIDACMGRRRWYMVPSDLITAAETPEGWGLLYVTGRKVKEVVVAPVRELSSSAAIDEALMLQSAIRRLLLGTLFDQKTGRWETLSVRQERERPGVAPEKPVV